MSIDELIAKDAPNAITMVLFWPNGDYKSFQFGCTGLEDYAHAAKAILCHMNLSMMVHQ